MSIHLQIVAKAVRSPEPPAMCVTYPFALLVCAREPSASAYTYVRYSSVPLSSTLSTTHAPPGFSI